MLDFLDAQPRPIVVSPLVLSDRLLTLAQDAESVGLMATASRLVQLACDLFDEVPTPRH
ncbi:MAG: hypothetical protein M3Y41_06940 [Pseudomonadota bacterium]|nr:hypothetical protein [Pseudomonadota bacterium]